MVQDLATQWIHSYPCNTKTSQEMEKSLRKFHEPSEQPKFICTDNSLEFGKSSEDLSWNHRTSPPHRSETRGEIQTREREDATVSDTSPVPVSNLVDDGSGRPDDNQANKIPTTNKKETTIERGDPLCSEIPEWLQEFKENSVDDEIPVQGGSHASSSHEVSLEPTTKRREDLGKHSVYTHFPKDRICEICKRTKNTRAPCRKRNSGAYLVLKNLMT